LRSAKREGSSCALSGYTSRVLPGSFHDFYRECNTGVGIHKLFYIAKVSNIVPHIFLGQSDAVP